ncbi:MAG: adenylate/guanylate cyclase domain-containing protein [Deltaproteobacteria bacterium]
MKPSPVQFVMQRLHDIIERNTGRSLSTSGEAEVQAALNELVTETLPSPLGKEFLSREVTILFADLRGFTAMVAGQPAGTVIQMLNDCLIKMSEIIFKHQGTIDKFMGDSIMVLFGVPVRRQDDVEKALACAVEMQIAMNIISSAHRERGMPEMYMGIGINTGNVLAGTLGSEHYSEYTVIGDEVNLASRIEAFSLRGQVLISQSTYECCKDFVVAADPIDIHVKGKPLPVSLRELIEIPSLGLKVPRKENRRSHRVEVNLPFHYQIIEHGVVLPAIRSGVIRDLGYHGAQLDLEYELPIYTEIKLGFDLQMLDYQARDVYAKILSRKPVDGSIRMGSEFTSVPIETNIKIQLYVQFLVFSDLP